MICMSRRSARSASPPICRTSAPLNQTSPELGSISRRMQRPVVDLPQPNSPTSPSVSPAPMSKLTPSTACTRSISRENTPPFTAKCLRRSRTDRRSAPLTARTARNGRAPTSFRGGISRVQISMAYLQRAAKRQPGGGSSRLGTVPEIASSRCFLRGAVDARDRADQALRVGVARIAEQLADRRLLDHLAGIHHRHPLAGLGDHAHGMGDQHDRHAEAFLHVLHQLEDLRLDGDVERRRRLVGDQELGLAGQRHGDHHALAHAAGELVRIVVHAALRVGDVDQPQHLDRAGQRLLGVELLVQRDHLGDLVAHRVDRVERGHRLLEDDGDLAGADLVHLVRRRAGSGRGPATGSGRPRSGRAACRSASAPSARSRSCRSPIRPPRPASRRARCAGRRRRRRGPCRRRS